MRKVSCMDLFEMANVVRDLSYDMAHFKAPMGRWQIPYTVLLSYYCNHNFFKNTKMSRQFQPGVFQWEYNGGSFLCSFRPSGVFYCGLFVLLDVIIVT